jgi:hypothetical protein
MDTNGNIKIGIGHPIQKNPLYIGSDEHVGRLEDCVSRTKKMSEFTSISSVGRIMMELLQKYVKDDGKVDIENLDRWSADSAAVTFLSSSITAKSLEILMEVRVFYSGARIHSHIYCL